MSRNAAILVSLLVSLTAGTSPGQQVKLVERAPDPHGSPRPARDAREVPLRTSLYLELGMSEGGKLGEVSPESVAVSLRAEGGESVELLGPGQRFAEGASGWIRPKQELSGDRAIAVYVEPGKSFKPATRHTVHVMAASAKEAGRSAEVGSWSFTTEADTSVHALTFPLDLGAQPVQWHGRFFSGICNVVFCTQAESYGPTYELMAEARKQHPRLELSTRFLADRNGVPAGIVHASIAAQHCP